MKNPKKYLHAARKMDIRQVARKAPDIAEIYAFDLQHEQYRQHQLITMLDDEERGRDAEQTIFEPFQEAEEDRVAGHNEDLLSVETFEREALEMQQHAEGNAFEVIAEMQGFDLQETRPYTVKQLPAAPSDLFDNNLTDVTEEHLQEELTNNTRSITPWKEKVRTALVHKENSPSDQPPKASHLPMPDTAAPELSEEQIQKALHQEEELKKANPASSVFFFRPPTKPTT